MDTHPGSDFGPSKGSPSPYLRLPIIFSRDADVCLHTWLVTLYAEDDGSNMGERRWWMAGRIAVTL